MTDEAAKTTETVTSATQAGWYLGTGRRKTAIARVRLKLGDGKIEVNGKKSDDYFTLEHDRKAIVSVLETTQTLGKIDMNIRVNGGGHTGQAEAIILGVARAIRKLDPAHEAALRVAGHLTRDSRMVERKKYGQSGARRRFQFSKR